MYMSMILTQKNYTKATPPFLRWFTLLLPIQKQLSTYPWLDIHTLSVTIWQNNQNKKHMYKSRLVKSN